MEQDDDNHGDPMREDSEARSSEQEEPVAELSSQPPPSKKPKVDDNNGKQSTSPTNPEPSPAETPQPPPSSIAPAKQRRKRGGKNKHVDPKVIEIRRVVQLACRDNDLSVAVEAYRRAKREGIAIEAQSFYNLLNLCDGLGSRHVHIGTPKQHTITTTPAATAAAEGGGEALPPAEAGGEPDAPSATASNTATAAKQLSPQDRLDIAFQIRADMKDLNLPLNETAYSALVKLLSKHQDFERAEAILDEAEQTQQCKPKLRLYSSLMLGYCEDGQMVPALKLWKRMLEIKRREQDRDDKSSSSSSSSSSRITGPINNTAMNLTEREYTALMHCATATPNPSVMEFVLTEVAEEVSIPAKDTVGAILDWFGSRHAASSSSVSATTTDAAVDDAHKARDEVIQQLLQEIDTLEYGNNNNNNNPTSSVTGPTRERPPKMGPVVHARGWEISSACAIDTSVGVLTEGCLKGFTLQPVPLSDRAFEDMKAMNAAIVFDGKIAGNECEFQGGRKGKKQQRNFSPQKREYEWKRFSDFLKCRANSPSSSTSPLDVVIDGANVGYFNLNFASAPKHVDYDQIDWVVEHFRRSEKYSNVLLVMHTRHFTRDMLPSKYRPLVEKWQRLGILYQTPFGMNDDWFWMHAALEYKALVLTNDEMRDHHFQMLAPRSFLRWKERHQVHFEFGCWEDGDNHGKRRRVELRYPKVYSRRIQRIAEGEGLVVPLAKKGDEHRFLDGTHLANEDEPVNETYLCFRPKAEKQGKDDNKGT